MSNDLSTRVGTVLNGTASGLVPMAVFTPVYAVWAVIAWPIPGGIFFAIALAWAATLAVQAGRIFTLARTRPRETNALDARITKGMTVVSSIQGGLIVVSVAVLALTGLWEWILPAVVLVVALHFFPMPAIFGRTIDYYLGTAMLIVAGVGLYLSAVGDLSWQTIWGITGVGAAFVTSTYGLWMLLTARRVRANYAARAERMSPSISAGSTLGP